MNGTAIPYDNGNGNGNEIKKTSLSFLNRLFNITPTQWPRVSECWFITFFFKVGSAIGWTVLTAAFVGQFGIAFLPTLFVLNAFLIIVGTFFFEQFIMRIKREVLMILMVLLAALSLFFASFVYDRSPIAFFTLVIFAESIFLAQFNVFIPILVGDRFTPLESQRTFPFIESADSMGGIIGGVVVGIFAEKFPIQWFLYIWIAALACIVIVFLITTYARIALPPLPFRVSAASNRDQPRNEIKQVFKSIKRMPFLKGLVAIVLLQWFFMNLLEFQYTKAIEQTVTRRQEKSIARVDPRMFQAAVLSSPDGVKNLSTVSPDRTGRALTGAEQASFAKTLGQLKGLFHVGAILIQGIFASRLITSLGVVGSMLLHPVIMLMSLVGMFLKFGFLSSVITRMNFEVTNVVHKNAYFASHYAMPRAIRDQAAEFLEGMVRPMGTIVSMLFILGLQFFFSGRDLTMWIHLLMFAVMAAILVSTIRLQPKYTTITRDQLFSDLPYPEKLNAIEILAQRGHKHSTVILTQKLHEIISLNGKSNEARIVRLRLISALGHAEDYDALPEILDALRDPDPDVRFEAAHSLMNFRDIGEHFYTQAFSRFRMIETLKEIFRNEKSSSVRAAIIRVFSLIRQPDIVAFLLDVLKEAPPDLKSDCIHTLGLFHDPNAAYYIFPYLSDPNPLIKANAIIALWQFHKYHPMLDNELQNMLNSTDANSILAGIYATGEIGLPWKRALLPFLHSEKSDLRFEAACALTKLGDYNGLSIILEWLLCASEEDFNSFRRFFSRLKPKAKRITDIMLVNFIAEHLHDMQGNNGTRALVEIDKGELEKLKRLYTLAHQHEELYAIETALQQKVKRQS